MGCGASNIPLSDGSKRRGKTQLSRIEELPTEPATPKPDSYKSLAVQTETTSHDKSSQTEDQESPSIKQEDLQQLIDNNLSFFSGEKNTGNSNGELKCQNVEDDEMQLLESEVFSEVNNKTADVAIQVAPHRSSSSTQTVNLKTRSTRSPEATENDATVAHQDDSNMYQSDTIIRKKEDNSTLPNHQDFESQTDKMTEILAANSADNDFNELLKSTDSLLPIQKNLSGSNEDRCGFNNSLNNLFRDIEKSLTQSESDVKRDVSVQTFNDPITDECPEYAAKPPPFRKREMIPNLSMFKEVDEIADHTPEEICHSLASLADYLCKNAENDLFRVRSIFRWIAQNISYNWNCLNTISNSEEILKSRQGVCKDYCQIFRDLCSAAKIRVKIIQGFAKGYEYRPGHVFRPGHDTTHNWIAVFILGSWHLVDPTWGTGFTDHSGKFQRKINGHFFLTDPEALIWTHFPYCEAESNYSRWQLLDKPLSLQEFNGLPKVSPYFFEFDLKIRSESTNRIVFRVQKEIKISCRQPMRFKYKFYPSDQVENASLNNYLFFTQKEDRLVASFLVCPPKEDQYYLKIYANYEPEVTDFLSTVPGHCGELHNCVTFLLECEKSRRYQQAYPMSDLPWGPTLAFFAYKMRLVNHNGPVLITWGGRRRLILDTSEPMLINYQVIDCEGIQLDPRSLIFFEQTDNRLTFTVSPTTVGMYKLMIFGMPKPKQKGEWKLPLLAIFLIECKMARIVKQLPEEEDPPPITIYTAELNNQANKQPKNLTVAE